LARPYNREGLATVRLPNHIHIVGASGSGTTSLAVEMAARYGDRHLDTDDYFWLPTIPPYREKRPREERLAFLREAARESKSWVLSCSLCGWGDPLIPEFEVASAMVGMPSGPEESFTGRTWSSWAGLAVTTQAV
jgi:hypothetical protein